MILFLYWQHHLHWRNALIKHFYIITTSAMWSFIRSEITKIGTCLKYGELIYDVIMDLFGIIFRNFYNKRNCMIIGFNLIYNVNSSRLKPNFNRDKKLLHVFWNTLYMLKRRFIRLHFIFPCLGMSLTISGCPFLVISIQLLQMVWSITVQFHFRDRVVVLNRIQLLV